MEVFYLSLVGMGFYVFRSCSAYCLMKPNSVNGHVHLDQPTIPARAFENCDTSKAVTLGSKVVSIANAAFYNCTNLHGVYNIATLLPHLGILVILRLHIARISLECAPTSFRPLK